MLRSFHWNRRRWGVGHFARLARALLIGLAAAGLRGPGVDPARVARAEAPATKNEQAAPADHLGLELVPPDVTWVVSVRPAEIAARVELRDLVRFVDDMARPLKDTNTSVRDIREIMLIKYGEIDQSGKMRTVVRFVDHPRQQQVLGALEGKFHMKKTSDSGVWEDGSERITALDPTTLVIEHVETMGENQFPRMKNEPPRWSGAWQERKDQPIVVAVDAAGLRANSPPFPRGGSFAGMALQVVAPVADHTDWAVLALELQNKIGLSATVKCDSADSANSVSETLRAVTVLVKNFAHEQSTAARRGPEAGMTKLALIKKISEEVGKILDRAEFKTEGERIHVALQSQLSPANIAAIAKSALPSVTEARQAARRVQSMNNLKQLALAMFNYEAQYRRFPAAVEYTYRVGGETRRSKYPHSWRVTVLPYLEGQTLYGEYHFDEPWDSEANKKVLAQMPDVFKSPHDSAAKSTNTSYFAFTGPATVFDGEKGAELRRITDGTSKTLLMAEAKQPVPWTKPEDIPYAADKPLPKLGGWITGEFLVAMSDGSVRPVSADIDEATLRAYITKAGGEITQDLPAPTGGR